MGNDVCGVGWCGWLPVVMAAVAAIFMRPAYLFLLPWIFVCGAMLRHRKGISWMASFRSSLTVSLLAACGDPRQFKSRHRAFMTSQSQWLRKARAAPQSQQAIWLRGDRNGRLNAARALDLDDMLVKSGQSVAEINACLSDDSAAKALIDNSKADHDEFGVPGTPSFALDGKLLEGVHNWEALYPVLSERFTPQESDGFAGD